MNTPGYPEILQRLLEELTALLGDSGAAFEITEYLRAHWSGRNLYFGKRRRPKRAPEPLPGQEALFGDAAEPEEGEEVPAMVEELRARAAEIVAGRGLPPDLAPEVAALVHGELIGAHYIPKGRAYEHAKRNEEIFRSASGATKIAVCRKYGLTEQRYYQILNKELRKRQAKFSF